MKTVQFNCNEGNTVTIANKLFMVLCILFFITQVLLGLFLSMQADLYGRDIADSMLTDVTYPVIIFNELILVLLPVVLYSINKRISITYGFRFNKLKIKNVLIVILLSVPLYVFLSSVNSISFYFLQRYIEIPVSSIPIPGSGGDFILSLFIIAFLPAVCEELFLRGVMLDAYYRRGAFSAIITGALFFAIFHFDISNFFAPFFFGLVIGYVVLKTDSIYAGILAHFLNNAIAQSINFYIADHENYKSVNIPVSDFQAIIIQSLIALLIVVCILILFSAVNGKNKLKKPIKNPIKGIVDILTHWPVIISFALYGFMIYMTLTL